MVLVPLAYRPRVWVSSSVVVCTLYFFSPWLRHTERGRDRMETRVVVRCIHNNTNRLQARHFRNIAVSTIYLIDGLVTGLPAEVNECIRPRPRQHGQSWSTDPGCR